jgi:hypothetical protein
VIDRAKVAECYTLAMTSHHRDVKSEELRAWHAVLEASGVDGDAAVQATIRLCMEPGGFPPTPGDVIAEVLAGTTPPALDAAIGFYLAGDWDAHPLVAVAARNVWWDRTNAQDQAVRQFRQFYAAAIEAESSRRRTATELVRIGEVRAFEFRDRPALASGEADDR